MNILTINNQVIDDIKFEKPRKMNDVYYSNISNNGNPCIVQINNLLINNDMNNISENPNPFIHLNISESNNDIYKFFLNLDNKIIDTTHNNSMEWFNKQLSKDSIEDMYKNILKPINNKCLKFKLPVKDNKIASKVYNQNNELININEINNKSDCIILLHIRGIKFLKQHFLCDSYICQIKITNMELLSDTCLIMDDKNHNIHDNDIIDNYDIEQINIYNEINNLKKLKKTKENKLKELEKSLIEINENIKKNINKLK